MPKKPTQGKVLTALHKGAVIMVEYVHEPRSEARTRYRLNTTGVVVASDLFERMLKNELIKSNDDGLPGIGGAQTYSIKRSSDK